MFNRVRRLLDNIQKTVADLAVAFDKTIPPNVEHAKNLIIQLRYLSNIENVCREWTPGKRIEVQH